MAVWTVFTADKACGVCGKVIPPNQPVAELMKGQIARPKLRCVTCAAREGFVVNDRHVDAARHAIEVARLAEATTPLDVAQFAAQSHVTRIALPRPLKPAAEIGTTLPFDFKSAAAGE